MRWIIGTVVEKVPNSYLSKSTDTLIESYSSKSESHPVNYLSKSQSIWYLNILKYQKEKYESFQIPYIKQSGRHHVLVFKTYG